MSMREKARGQSMLEFSLIFPMILLVVLMFIEIGRVVYYYSALNNAVREGARFGIVCPSVDYGIGEACLTTAERLSKIRDRVVGYAIWLPLDPGQVSVTCDDPPDTDNPCDETLTVSADLQVTPMSAFIANILGAGTAYDLHAESTMRMAPWGSQ